MAGQVSITDEPMGKGFGLEQGAIIGYAQHVVHVVPLTPEMKTMPDQTLTHHNFGVIGCYVVRFDSEEAVTRHSMSFSMKHHSCACSIMASRILHHQGKHQASCVTSNLYEPNDMSFLK